MSEQAFLSIAESLQMIAEAIRPAYSLATVEALRITTEDLIYNNPRNSGEIGLAFASGYRVRKDNTEGKSLIIDLYGMGWRHTGAYAFVSIHQILWDDPVKVPQAWIEAGLVEGESASVPRARVLFQLHPTDRNREGNPRVNVLTVEIPPPDGDLPPLLCEVIRRHANGDATAKTELAEAPPGDDKQPTSYNWLSRGAVVQAVKAETGETPTHIKGRLKALHADGTISPDDSDMAIIAALLAESEAA